MKAYILFIYPIIFCFSNFSVRLVASEPSPEDLVRARRYNLTRLNDYRAGRKLAPLQLDEALTSFAEAGADEYSMDHIPHKYFLEHSDDSVFCDAPAAENTAMWNINGLDDNGFRRAIDEILETMYSEGPAGGHYRNMLSRNASRLGVGLVVKDERLWFTNDFAGECTYFGIP